MKDGKKTGEATFYNPIMKSGADPWVVRKDGYYYYMHTVGNAIQLWKSNSLTDLAAAETATVWQPSGGGPASSDIWAPELHWIQGKWYIYFAADDGSNETHRMYVLQSETDDALGAYKEMGQITDPTDKWAIDGTVLTKKDGSLYFVWSGWEGDENVTQKLYIAPMSNPYTISGNRVEISKPELAWETIGQPTVNEGPEVLVSDKKINIVYSASGSWTDDYTLGLLSADPDSNLLDPASWKKHPEPAFAKTDDVFGPGHASFVKSPDGKEDWIVYHAAKTAGAGWDRNVRIQPFQWNDDGTPNFGKPVSTRTALALPSGENGRVRLEAEEAKLEGLLVKDREDASGGKTVGSDKDGARSATFNIEVEKDGLYTLALRYLNEGAVVEQLTVTVNGKLKVDVSLDAGFNGEWSNDYIPVPLKKGSNEVKFSGGDSWLSLDAIDVLPPQTKP
ncbi:family 43 glycosylhydrolase [Cohnella candidum]|uniref:Alpha-N-arabinofuranosidase n=1 Tax=Cohnella candidum TaxID=2674991 RepID=A0A3G3JTJ2_9BACL|nr:family 43 glycosylhydrolase [Cohnella candidum]AYQ71524.1 alpha-N-arabinofuranosidase [Cohnella candidum]